MKPPKEIPMKLFHKLIVIVVFLAPALTVQGLDKSGTITVTQLLKTTESWDHKPIVYPDGTPEVTGSVVELAPGRETGWHQHSAPSFAMVLEGTLEVSLKTGEVKRLHAGEALAEVVNTLHNGRNVGHVPVKLVVFYVGTVGQTLTVKQSDVESSMP